VEAGLDVDACLERVRAQDAEAARALVEYLYPLVARIVRTRLPRRVDEADLMQEIFMKMFTHLDAYQAAAPFEHWVSRIAVNTCLNHLRAEKSRPEFRWADLPEEQMEALEAALSAPDEARPIDQLAARELVEKQDASIADVQEQLGWSSVRIRVRAFRARAKLRQNLKRLLQEGSL
jgi:RNA polymerase sigma-70 factor, ECF subfamily